MSGAPTLSSHPDLQPGGAVYDALHERMRMDLLAARASRQMSRYLYFKVLRAEADGKSSIVNRISTNTNSR